MEFLSEVLTPYKNCLTTPVNRKPENFISPILCILGFPRVVRSILTTDSTYQLCQKILYVREYV